jgi:hypothetical protein
MGEEVLGPKKDVGIRWNSNKFHSLIREEEERNEERRFLDRR